MLNAGAQAVCFFAPEDDLAAQFAVDFPQIPRLETLAEILEDETIQLVLNIAGKPGANHLFLVDKNETQYIDCQDVPLPYGPALNYDIINRTETAMTQDHSFLSMELALKAEAMADRIGHLK